MNNLVLALIQTIHNTPKQQGRTYTGILRRNGYVNISKHEVNSLLYARKDLFVPNLDERLIPHWEVTKLALSVYLSNKIHEEQFAEDTEINKIAPTQTHLPLINNQFNWEERFGLYDWQVRALNAWQAQYYRGIIQAVTGSGKTRLALAAISRHLQSGWKILIIVHTLDIRDQWSTNIQKYFPNSKLGFLGGNYHQSLRFVDILISTSNSAQIYNVASSSDKVFIIADEVHHYGTNNSINMFEPFYHRRLGLTASLERNDDGVDKVITPYFGDSAYVYEYSEAIDDGVIAPIKILFVSVPMNDNEQEEYENISRRLSKLRNVVEERYAHIFNSSRGTYTQKLNRLPGKDKDVQILNSLTRKRTRMVVDMESKIAALKHLIPAIQTSKGTFIFTQSKMNSIQVKSILAQSTIRFEYIDGEIDSNVRKSVLERFGNKQLQAIAAPQILDEGIDVPSADLGIITGKSSSRRQLIQRLGRVARRKQDGGYGHLVILISEGTIEDPAVSNSDAFYEVFSDTNTPIDRIEVTDNAHELINFLKGWQ